MSQNNDSPYLDDSELSLRDLILRLRDFGREVMRHWKIVAAAVILFTAVFLVRAWLKPAVYPARLTFMINEEEGSNLGGVATVLGQFGLSAGSSGSYNRDRIVELARSHRIVRSTLLDSATIDGKGDLLANHLIRIYNYPENRWRKNEKLKSFTFQSTAYPHDDRKVQGALKSLYGHMAGDPQKGVEPLFRTGYNDETGILYISTQTVDEQLSIVLADMLYQHLSNFYVEQSIQRQQQTYDNLQVKTDSVRQELQRAENALARLEDASYGLTLQRDRLQRDRLDREVRMLNVLYAEVVRNMETAAFLLKNATPVFQVIDVPVGPIEAVGASKRQAVFLGGLIGGLLGIIGILGRKVYRELMIEEGEG